jgi:transcriptional regulator with XRE-family HTH domain
MEFSTKLRVMRAMRGMSQLELSKATGIPNTYLSDFETGKTLPTPDVETRIREALDWGADTEKAFAILEGQTTDCTESIAAS